MDDDTSKELSDAIQRGAMGDVFLSFRTRVVQVPTLDLVRYRETRNRVALSFLPNMRGDLDPVERVILVALAFHQQQDTEGLHRFFAFWVVEGRLELVQQRNLERRLKEMDMPEIITWWLEEGEAKGLSKGIQVGRQEGLEEGIRTSRLEYARKMHDHGIPWEVVTDVTGIKPEDLA